MTTKVRDGALVVLRHTRTDKLVAGKLNGDYTWEAGSSSYIEVRVMAGLPVVTAVFDTNEWEFVGGVGIYMDDKFGNAMWDVIHDLLKDAS